MPAQTRSLVYSRAARMRSNPTKREQIFFQPEFLSLSLNKLG